MNNRKEELFMFDRLDDILIRFEELLHELGDPVLTSDPEKFLPSYEGAGRACPSGGDLYTV